MIIVGLVKHISVWRKMEFPNKIGVTLARRKGRLHAQYFLLPRDSGSHWLLLAYAVRTRGFWARREKWFGSNPEVTWPTSRPCGIKNMEPPSLSPLSLLSSHPESQEPISHVSKYTIVSPRALSLCFFFFPKYLFFPYPKSLLSLAHLDVLALS